MELQENRTKAINTQRQSGTCSVEVPESYSRQKAIKKAKDKGGRAIPEKEARINLYMMFVKIGATGEVPQENDLRVSFMNDFWRVIYLENNFCPGDIPFPIIMEEFTKAMIHGIAERKGNNQAAICQAFNKWITREDVRTKLYQKRDAMYPHKKPKQIPIHRGERLYLTEGDDIVSD